MSDKPTDPIELYGWLKQQISELEKELDEVKDEVYALVKEDGGEVERETFIAKCTKRPKYKFSADYNQKSDELKLLKKTEIDDGIATIDGYSEFVTFRFKKSK